MTIRIPWWTVFLVGMTAFSVTCALNGIDFLTWKGVSVWLPMMISVFAFGKHACECERKKAGASREHR